MGYTVTFCQQLADCGQKVTVINTNTHTGSFPQPGAPFSSTLYIYQCMLCFWPETVPVIHNTIQKPL